MDRMLYVAMNAAKQILHAQGLATNNLANTSTSGFKADLLAVRAVPVFGPGEPTRVFALTERPGTDLRAGSLATTGSDLDVAIDGPGWFTVLARDGNEAYTRAGALRVNVNGLLETVSGEPVVGNGGLITLPQAQALVVGSDGTISIRPLGQEANTMAQLDRLKLVNPDSTQLVKGEDGLFRLRAGGDVPPAADVRVTQGAIEASNVNPINEMINVISLARRYEMVVSAMQTAKENDAASASQLRLNG
jgi:flagellar basal-body rod protein FlgF